VVALIQQHAIMTNRLQMMTEVAFMMIARAVQISMLAIMTHLLMPMMDRVNT
jgi:hypothetical protein